MSKIVGVQFQTNGKMYYFDAEAIDVRMNEYVIVDTMHGIDLGEVVFAPGDMEIASGQEALRKVIRVATEQDLQRGRENRKKEKEAFAICQKKIEEHKLEMKLVSVEYAFDGNKVMFYFTANGRVDFRSLVKDLASVFKMRIELRQIGVRDEAKMLGGLGPCGRPICCGTFLSQFQPVSIKMAKEQNLSLNPTKISGVCGRLMCCLKYEQDHYEQTRKKMPKVGKIVITPDGSGPVTELNIIKETVFVRLMNGDTAEIREYPLENITRAGDNVHHEKVPAPAAEPAEYTEELPEPDTEEKEQEPASASREAASSGRDEERRSNRNRNHGKNHKHQLGQPVKRENPNRAAGKAAEDAAPAKKEQKAPQPKKAAEPAPKAARKTGSSWADAVQNAMRAIEGE